QNSFTDILGPLGLNVYSIITVDLHHEFELGIFKSVFKHLLKLLYVIHPNTVIQLNEWYGVSFNFHMVC
ncbi:hypothetical protein M404DRAFT_120241, partial [Pisolithus tinctorius Marx 270]